ncbi:MAG: hypothetical protein MJA29_14590, partial [Candidatus Omnitrophica bacterium]|nr:hypothetical protein [Candidatus Omnitrophota bacterium]
TLISFDVESLFTNVPLSETIDLIANQIYDSESKPPFDKETFIKLMERATSGLFLYKDKLYKQVDGVTMGSPLGPTLANFCLAHMESKLLPNTTTETKPALYLRYVDDIFCIFRNGISYEPFFQSLNDLHRNLRFTFELGPNSLPFLDTLVKVTDGQVTTEVYRKPTYTGLMLNVSATCPLKWKTGLMQCLLHRAYTICSNWSLFTKEDAHLEHLFSLNGYSNQMFQSCVNRYVSGKFQKRQERPPKEDSVEAPVYIPYIGQPSVIYGKKIRQIFKQYYKMNIRVIFTTFKVKNYFSLKCRTPFILRANVVYKYTCLRDADVSYIGKTKRHMALRMKEHFTDSNSAIRQHLLSCPTCPSDHSSFSIMDTGRSEFECIIKEALHIKSNKPLLNKQLFNTGSVFTLQLF